MAKRGGAEETERTYMGVWVELKVRLNGTLVLLASSPSGWTETSMTIDLSGMLDDTC